MPACPLNGRVVPCPEAEFAYDEHQAIAEALQAGDLDQAHQATDTHLASTMRSLGLRRNIVTGGVELNGLVGVSVSKALADR
jgi:hypothetical protein